MKLPLKPTDFKTVLSFSAVMQRASFTQSRAADLGKAFQLPNVQAINTKCLALYLGGKSSPDIYPFYKIWTQHMQVLRMLAQGLLLWALLLFYSTPPHYWMILCSLSICPEPDSTFWAKTHTPPVHNCLSRCCYSCTWQNSLNTQYISFWHSSLERMCCAKSYSALAEIKWHFVGPRSCSSCCSELH